MDVRNLYSTIGSVVFATVFAAVMVASSTSARHNVLHSAKKQQRPHLHPRGRRKKMVEFHCRGWVISATAEEGLFRNNALIDNIRRTLRYLQQKCIPINSFFLVYYSKYCADQLSVEMRHLDTINERNNWLEEARSDGFMSEPEIEYPLR